MKRNHIVLILVSCSCIYSQIVVPDRAIAQLDGYEILKTDISARASGMSGAFVGMTGDIHALFYNPAGLIGLQKKTVGLTYIDHLLDFKAGSIIYGLPSGLKSKYAFGINYINYGSFDGRDNSGAPTTSFSAQDAVFVAGYASEYSSNIYYGINSKFLYSNIDEFSSTLVAFDGGVIYAIPEYMLTIGVSVANIGFVASAFVNTKESVPAVAKAGLTKKLAHLPLLISAEFRQFFDGEFQVVGGGELAFSDSLTGRVGYDSHGPDQKIDDEGGPFAGASVGFGFQWQSYTLDYSYNSFGVIGDLQWITLTTGL